MGQRSQIYVRYEKDGKNYLTARYYQWNYGERMISRCRWTIEWIKANLAHEWYFTAEKEKLMRIMDVNFDMHDIVIGCDIVKEYNDYRKKYDDYSFNDYILKYQDNNDGKLFIYIKDDVIKYAFLDSECNTEDVMDAEQYMTWNCENWIESEYIDDEYKEEIKANFAAIEGMAVLMTKEEVEDFIGCVYYEEELPF